MADTDTEPLPNGTGGALSEEDYERMNQRPADIDADVRAMERGKRVEALMSSKLFREELERVLDQQLHEGGDAPLLQRIREMVGGRLHSGSFRGPSCVLPINDIRGMEGVGYEKGEKILRCKLAAAYRLVDLFGWTQTGNNGQITARLNTAVEQVLTTPRGVLPHEVTASSLVKVDMQGAVVDQGTTNFPVNVEGFSVHAMVHAARPDLKCVLHVRAPAALAVSSMKDGILPLSTEAALLGDVAYHQVPYGTLDNEEQEKLVRALGPHAKVLILSNDGALCCGATLEEAFYQARNLTAACDVQLRLASLPIERLSLMDDDTRRQIYESSRKPPADQQKWRAGGEEFEALMRMLDNAGFRTGYVYRHPLIKNDVPRPKNDVEVPPAVSSLGYLLEEEELYRQGLWKKGHGKTGERTRWLNSPNVYQKVEVLETGTNDPKKITKWVDANNEEWVQDGSPQHSSTPVKIDTLQFVPKNTNPKEFKKLQQQIKDNRRADMISAGPQSHILEGVTWDEAAKLTEDAANTATGDHVVLMGAASKGIIQRGYQHNATVYSAPYARNPFDRVTDSEIADYRRIVERKQRGIDDTDVSDSEALSGAQFTSPLSETEDESRDEHRVLRIETKQAPVRSQPEIVLSDDFINAERAHSDRTKDASPHAELPPTALPRTSMQHVAPAVTVQSNVVRGNLTNQDLNANAQALTEALTSNQRTKHDYSRAANFEKTVQKFDSPDNDNNVTAANKFSSPGNATKHGISSFADYANANKRFGTPYNANVFTAKKCSSSEIDNTNTAAIVGNVTNIIENSNFYKVRERFNSPESDNKFTSKSCAEIEIVHSPVYENIKKFNSNSCGNVKDNIHPKCKVNLHARLSGEGNTDVKNVKQAFDKGSQTDVGHDVYYACESKLKSYSNLSGLAKLASEIKNDAFNLNSKIAIETLNSKLASDANYKTAKDTFKLKLANEANSKITTEINSKLGSKVAKIASDANYEVSQHSKNSQHAADEELYSYALDLYNPGHNSPRSSLYSIPSIDWDRRLDYTCRSRSLPRQTKTKEQRLYRTQSHSGFVNARIKDPEPTHFHLPRCNSCGATNVSYNWELIREDLSKCSGRKLPTSLYMSVDDIHQKCVKDELRVKSTGKMSTIPNAVQKSVNNTHQKCQDEANKVTVTAKVVPVYKVATLEEEFVDSQEFNDDNYFGDIGNSFSSTQTVIERINVNDTLKSEFVEIQKGEKTDYHVKIFESLKDDVSSMQEDEKATELDDFASCGDVIFKEGCENLHRAEYVIIDDFEKMTEKDSILSNDEEYLKVVEKDNTLSTEGEYHSFTDEIDFDSAYISPVKDLVEKDIRDYSVPIGLYCDDYKKESPKKPQSPKRPVTPKSPLGYCLEPILEESKSSYGDESGNLSNSDVRRQSGESTVHSDVKRNSGESTNNKSTDSQTSIKVDSSGISRNIQETSEEHDKNFERDFPEIPKAGDRNANEIENINQDASERETISVQVTFSKPKYETTITGIDVLYKVKSQSTEDEKVNEQTKTCQKLNDIQEDKIIATKETADPIESDIVNNVLQEIFTTAVTAVQITSELNSSSIKVTQEFLNSELNRADSYLIAEEDDFTTNDIESIATNVVQTAIDVYSEEEHLDIHETDIDEGHDTDMMDCVYDNIFEILSEDAISSKDFKTGNFCAENDTKSLNLYVEGKENQGRDSLEVLSEKATSCTAVVEDVDTKINNIVNQDQPAVHNYAINSSEKSIVMEEREKLLEENLQSLVLVAETHYISAEHAENDKQDVQAVSVKPYVASPTKSSIICIEERKFSFESFASSGFDLRSLSFDSTAEFEKYEAVTEVLSCILNKIEQASSCEIFNFVERRVVTNFEFDKKVTGNVDEFITDEPVHLKLQLPCDLQNAEDDIHQNVIINVETPEIRELAGTRSAISFNSQDNSNIQNYSEEMLTKIDTENLTHSIIIELPFELQDHVEYSKTDAIDVLDTFQSGELIQPETEFSIAKIIQIIENKNLSETVSTEPSETENEGHKVAEALMYYIFDRVFCSLGEKTKPTNNRKNKKVVTVADSEDILLTAKSIWTAEGLDILQSGNLTKDLKILESDKPDHDLTSNIPAEDLEIIVSDETSASVNHEENFTEQIMVEEAVVQLQLHNFPKKSDSFLEATIQNVEESHEKQVENVGFYRNSSKINNAETNNSDIADTSKGETIENSKSIHNADICDATTENVTECLEEPNLCEHKEDDTYPNLYNPDPDYNHTDPDSTHEYPDSTPDVTDTVDCNQHNATFLSENVEYSLQEHLNTTVNTDSYENESHETANLITTTAEHAINKKSHNYEASGHEMANLNSSLDPIGSNESNSSRHVIESTDEIESRDSNESINNDTYNVSDGYNESFDMAKSIDGSETSKAENHLNQTFILEKSSDISMNTAFVLDNTGSYEDRASSPQKVIDISVFESCSESPIKNSDSLLEDSENNCKNSAFVYEREDTLLGSPFIKRASVISMSQTANTGGVKYWVSFDDGLTESLEKNSYRAIRKSRNEMPSFFSVDFAESHDSKDSKKPVTLYERNAKRRKSVLLDEPSFNQSTDTKRTEDSFATACVSTDCDYHTCESDFIDSKTETVPQKKLLYNSSTDLHTKSSRREYNSWPPYENTLYYKIISKFRMSESFDTVDFENIQINDRQ